MNILMELEIEGEKIFSYENRKAALTMAYENSDSGIRIIRTVLTIVLLIGGLLIIRQ